MRIPITLASLLILLAVAAAAPAGGFALTGTIADPELDEVSGIAASHRLPGVFWVHNDSNNPAAIFAIDQTGAVLARVAISGARNVDWEDIASYELDGRAYLALADIGNNFSLNEPVHIYVLPEPALTDTEVKPVRDYRFEYADGSRDAESLAVDLQQKRFLILDKGRQPAGLYALPMDGVVALAQRIADVPYTWPEPEALVSPLAKRVRGAATAADLSADGRRLLMLSYRHIMVFERGAGEDWPQALARKPRWSRLPDESGLGWEAACWSRDGRTAYVTGERQRAAIYQWEPR